MKILFIVVLLSVSISNAQISNKNIPVDNEFAEFEVVENAFEGEDKVKQEDFKTASTLGKEEPAEKNEEDFAFLGNEDEFEKMEEKKLDTEEVSVGEKKKEELKPLVFADMPAHFRSNWSSYQVEAIALGLIFLYALFYLYGKLVNHSIAYNWFLNNREALESQFTLVGDDGLSQEPVGGRLVCETDYSYILWCSGRVGCHGMLTHIRLNKRQDLMGWTINLFQPKPDRVTHKITLDKNEMDSFVFVLGNRKSVPKVVKDSTDLATYTTERKNVDKFGIPDSFSVFCEIGETIPAVIDNTCIHFIRKHDKYIDFIHVSDQYSGPKIHDETVARLPDVTPTIIFSFILKGDEEKENVYPDLITFMFMVVDRVRRYRLGRESKIKAEKKRQSVEELFFKTTHLQRQEAAQARREEKTRERKQRVLEEEDPEKQKRLEKIEQKRDAKLRQPKMKQFKLK